MTPTFAPTRTVQHRAGIRQPVVPSRRRRPRKKDQPSSGHAQRQLGQYTDPQGSPREVLTRPGAAGSVLVLDRDHATHGDRRLVAHLAADEPAENAALICASYLQDMAVRHYRCRALTSEDMCSIPFAEQPDAQVSAKPASYPQPIDRHGCRYQLKALPAGMSIPELRWCRDSHGLVPEPCEPVSVREAIASVESYEPVCAVTIQALSLHSAREISTTVLRSELARVQQSPIVLNRRLREVLLVLVAHQELSMSEIAIRCGRIKRDRKGNESGETSWLARRIGLLPEGGQRTPTPWIHSDVLALIARDGLGISPREVEL
jgi:hypothetical protein